MKRLITLVPSTIFAFVFGVQATAYAQSVFFHEDFSGFEIGDAASDWGANSVVLKAPEGKDKRKFLSTQVEGEETVEHKVAFPPNFTLRFDVMFAGWQEIPTRVVLIDADDSPIEIQVRESGGRARFKMPNTVEVVQEMKLVEPERAHHVAIVRKDKTIKLFWDDELMVASNYPNEGKLERFKIKFKAGTYFTSFVGEERAP